MLQSKKTFDAIRRDTLIQHRDPQQTAASLREMRDKQISERTETPIKKRINDLQFVAEFGVLTQAHQNEALIDARSPDAQVPLLKGPDATLMQQLIDAWHTLNQALHHQWLDRMPEPLDERTLLNIDAAIDKAWQALLP